MAADPELDTKSALPAIAVSVPTPMREITAEEFEYTINQATAKASILATLVEKQGLYQQIGQKKYLNVEAWQTIGAGYGYIAQIEWCRPLNDMGGGWEARAIVMDSVGNQLGAAEAECGTEGDRNWMGRSSFQQRSMAQTRAISRALRVTLSWVVVLAGYAATPSEEMDGVNPDEPEPMCEKHNIAWFKSAKMFEWAHTYSDGSRKDIWCGYPRDEARDKLVEVATAAGVSPQDAKTKMYGDKLFKDLSPAEVDRLVVSVQGDVAPTTIEVPVADVTPEPKAPPKAAKRPPPAGIPGPDDLE